MVRRGLLRKRGEHRSAGAGLWHGPRVAWRVVEQPPKDMWLRVSREPRARPPGTRFRPSCVGRCRRGLKGYALRFALFPFTLLGSRGRSPWSARNAPSALLPRGGYWSRPAPQCRFGHPHSPIDSRQSRMTTHVFRSRTQKPGPILGGIRTVATPCPPTLYHMAAIRQPEKGAISAGGPESRHGLDPHPTGVALPASHGGNGRQDRRTARNRPPGSGKRLTDRVFRAPEQGRWPWAVTVFNCGRLASDESCPIVRPPLPSTDRVTRGRRTSGSHGKI